jgi:hypothetical protein
MLSYRQKPLNLTAKILLFMTTQLQKYMFKKLFQFLKLKNTAFSLLIIGMIVLVCQCATPPNYPDEPVITFKSISRNYLKQNSNSLADSLLLVFSFTDGDGDLGSNDSVGIYIKDGRDGFEKPPYKIPYINPQGTGNGISGEISIRLNTTCCTFDNGYPPCSVIPNVPYDTLTYQVYIRDRAGNKSNQIETPPILLYCQ